MKKLLKFHNVDLIRLAELNEKIRVRRKIRKLNVLDKSISIPQEESNFKVNDKIKKMIIDGKIIIGDLIVPQTQVRDNTVVNDVNVVKGRKVPFNYIRSSLLQRHDKFLRLRKDEEYDDMSRDEIFLGLKRINDYEISDINTNAMLLLGRLKGFERKRHLCVWHDTSPICNHSHLLITINCCYDPAIFYTNQEYEEKYKKYVDVQACVEDPAWYILARCSPSENQIMYIQIRLEDINKLKSNIKINGTEITDEMAFFKGDGPASQFEVGHQKGGNYFCLVCELEAGNCPDYVYSSSLPYMSLEDRRKKVLLSDESCRRSDAKYFKYFDALKKGEIIVELQERGVSFFMDESKASLQKKLEKALHGMQRVPSLLFSCPQEEVNNVNLGRYELLMEPMHNIANHIKNVFQEIPLHFSDEKKDILSFISTTFNCKGMIRCVDYRNSLLLTALNCQREYPHSAITDIFVTLSQIQNFCIYQIIKGVAKRFSNYMF